MTNAGNAVRIRHYQGERLRARDLQDEHANLAWMRGLHVVALHDTWGISLGFDAHYLVEQNGRRSVLVTPGFAYDYHGREILLAQSQRVYAPSVSGGIELVMRYEEALGGDRDELLPCPSGRERPAFVWRRAGETRLGLEIPLLGITAEGEPDLSVRRYAQPMVRPHMSSGLTAPEQYWWNWTGPAVLNVPLISFQTWVDTSAAGFVQTPAYQAQLYYPATAFKATDTFGSLAARSSLLFASATDPYPYGFLFQFAVARGQVGVAGAGLDWANFPMPQVAWMGIEPIVGCAPQINWKSVALQFNLPMFDFF